jgi:nucleoside-diphosphate-sugar epimerase
MRVLVTGSHGYIGSVAAPLLAEAGHDVLGIDTRLYANCDFGPDLRPVPILSRDIRDVAAADLRGVDAVVHLAALSNDPLGELDPGLTRKINGEATVALAQSAREAGVRRFVFASSCSMYGASGSDEALNEDAPLRPITAYAESKVLAEDALLEMAGPDFAPVSMRNATVYGSSPRLRLDIVLNNLAAWSHCTGEVRLLSDGTAWRPLIHVRDVAKVALGLLEAPEGSIRGQAVNVGSDDQNYRIRELAEMLSEITGCAVEVAEGSSADNRSYRVDFSKLRALLPGVELDWNAELGARELIDAYRTVGLTLDDFEGDSYVRLRRLHTLLDEGLLDDSLRWRQQDADPPRVDHASSTG